MRALSVLASAQDNCTFCQLQTHLSCILLLSHAHPLLLRLSTSLIRLQIGDWKLNDTSSKVNCWPSAQHSISFQQSAKSAGSLQLVQHMPTSCRTTHFVHYMLAE